MLDTARQPGCRREPEAISPAVIETRELGVRIGSRTILHRVNLSIRPGQVFGVIGPSGAGKSTLLKCLNRLIDLTPGASVSGDVRFRGQPVYGPGASPADDLRVRIGMLFQQPVVFPTSVFNNVVFGLRHLRMMRRRDLPSAAEAALRSAALWDEVKDRLSEPAQKLSVGQQQRLCLARVLSMRPEVILMDEPTSALDPRSTEAIEQLISGLKQRHTIVLVTHNLAQARRVADWLACVCLTEDGAGTVVESSCCDQMLENPLCREAIDYLKHQRQ